MEEKVRAFILKRILPGRKALAPGDSLFGAGAIDSIGHLQLVTFLEKEFGVSFTMSDFTSKNFDTLEGICSVVRSKQEKNEKRGSRR